MFATHIIELILPALIPSWNFFDVIVPSPRIQVCLLKKQTENTVWSEFRPRPNDLSLLQMIGRMFWNARWNESLYMVSCAERLMEYPTKHSENEIFKRIVKDIALKDVELDVKWVKFRLMFIRREENELVEEIQYESELRLISNELI